MIFHPGSYIPDELLARGWTTLDLVERMDGNPEINLLAIGFLIHTPDVLLGEDMAASLGKAFGTSTEFWLNLEREYRAKQPFGREMSDE